MKKETQKNTGAHYNRVMSEKFETFILNDYKWLIDFVKKEESLDFQTGYNKGMSWFSIYRGTSRILRFYQKDKGKPHIDADATYKLLFPELFYFENLNETNFKKYLGIVKSNKQLEKYYSNKKEGYYQTLIGRRYTFNMQPDDEFVIIDKELVIGFESDTYRINWNKEIVKEQDLRIEKARTILSETRLPKDIKREYGEFDFLAIDKQGNFIIMELKQDDAVKTYLSPVQTNYYVLQFEKLIKEKKEELCKVIKDMLDQKVNMGLIELPKGWKLPEKMNCSVKACVVIGNEKGVSKEVCKRYKVFRTALLPRMEAFMAKDENDGTLIKCDILS